MVYFIKENFWWLITGTLVIVALRLATNSGGHLEDALDNPLVETKVTEGLIALMSISQDNVVECTGNQNEGCSTVSSFFWTGSNKGVISDDVMINGIVVTGQSPFFVHNDMICSRFSETDFTWERGLFQESIQKYVSLMRNLGSSYGDIWCSAYRPDTENRFKVETLVGNELSSLKTHPHFPAHTSEFGQPESYVLRETVE